MLKTALIGLGRIGWNYHLPEILKHHNDYEFCAAVDTDEERLSEVKAAYGTHGYKNYREMLEKETPDLVVIASPTVFHEEQAIASLYAGADVILDKPMANDLESSQRIVDIYRKTGRKLTVYQPYRFLPITTVAKRIIDSGILGPVYQIKFSRCQYVRRNDWQCFLKNGGGMLNNYGAHHIDQLLYLCGEKVQKMFCQTSRIAGLGDADDVVKLVLQTEQGTILDIDINQAAAIPMPQMMIFGRYGAATLQDDAEGGQEFYLKYFDPAELPERELFDSLAAPDRQYPSEQIPWKEKHEPISSADAIDYYGACARYFRQEDKAPVSPEETLYIMELIDRGKKIAKNFCTK